MLGHLALIEHDVLLGIDPTGDEGGGDLADGLGQFGGILPHRDGVQIDHAIDALVAALQLDEAFDGAEVVAEMQVAGGLHPGEHQFLERHRHLRAAGALNAITHACPARPGRYSRAASASFHPSRVSSCPKPATTFSASAMRSST